MLTAQWRRSTGACLVARATGGAVEVADSKQAASPVLQFGPESWRQVVTAIRVGEFGGAQ